MVTEPGLDIQLERLSGLAERQRRALYTFVAGAPHAVSRDEAAAAVGMSRPLAAYHLDRLVDDGLLEVRFERRTGRSGPGAGRPAKLYQRSAHPVELSIPARDYAFLAELLAEAIELDASGEAAAALWQIARETGVRSPEQASVRGSNTNRNPRDDLRLSLASRGYEPYADDTGDLRLRNCPFHRLAAEHRELICTANLALITGISEQTGVEAQPRLDPRPGECCVVVPGRQS